MTFAPLPYDYHPLQCESWKRFSFPNLTAASAALKGGFPGDTGTGPEGEDNPGVAQGRNKNLKEEDGLGEENAGPGTAWQ